MGTSINAVNSCLVVGVFLHALLINKNRPTAQCMCDAMQLTASKASSVWQISARSKCTFSRMLRGCAYKCKVNISNINIHIYQRSIYQIAYNSYNGDAMNTTINYKLSVAIYGDRYIGVLYTSYLSALKTFVIPTTGWTSLCMPCVGSGQSRCKHPRTPQVGGPTYAQGLMLRELASVSYTHLTLPTNREV